MNPVQRLLSNTTLAFINNIGAKLGSSVLFIFVGRLLGPSDAGAFNLGITLFTIITALSDLGLQELFIREVAPRREESGRYLTNYLAMRTITAVITYGILVLLIYFLLPYQPDTKKVILILGLAVLPEAFFTMLQAFFVAHEQLLIPTISTTINSGLKIGFGLWLLGNNHPVTTIAWVIPISSAVSLIIFIPGLLKLFRQVPQIISSRLDIPFSLEQLRFMPGFVLISISLTLNFQLDTFFISLYLSESDLGWYGAAQTIVIGFWMMATAFRTTIYPMMSRAEKEAPEKLPVLYLRSHQYLLLTALPIATGVTLLAKPIIDLVYTNAFEEAVPALQIMIWAVVFAFLNVPNARLVLVKNRQQQAGWMMGVGMVVNVLLNLLLIPPYGILGASAARTISTAILFFQLYFYSQRHLGVDSILTLTIRPLLATGIMAAVVWPIRHLPILWPIIIGVVIYGLACYLLKAIPEDARQRLWQLTMIRGR